MRRQIVPAVILRNKRPELNILDSQLLSPNAPGQNLIRPGRRNTASYSQ